MCTGMCTGKIGSLNASRPARLSTQADTLSGSQACSSCCSFPDEPCQCNCKRVVLQATLCQQVDQIQNTLPTVIQNQKATALTMCMCGINILDFLCRPSVESTLACAFFLSLATVSSDASVLSKWFSWHVFACATFRANPQDVYENYPKASEALRPE